VTTFIKRKTTNYRLFRFDFYFTCEVRNMAITGEAVVAAALWERGRVYTVAKTVS
jgi:hypothetical protein